MSGQYFYTYIISFSLSPSDKFNLKKIEERNYILKSKKQKNNKPTIGSFLLVDVIKRKYLMKYVISLDLRPFSVLIKVVKLMRYVYSLMSDSYHTKKECRGPDCLKMRFIISHLVKTC